MTFFGGFIYIYGDMDFRRNSRNLIGRKSWVSFLDQSDRENFLGLHKIQNSHDMIGRKFLDMCKKGYLGY
jgi:hypothetical protein